MALVKMIMTNKKQKPEFSLNIITEMFPEHLTEEDKCVIAIYIEFLLSGITPKLSSVFSVEISKINRYILPHIINRELYVDGSSKSIALNSEAFEIIDKVHKSLKGKIIKYHACAFITSILQYRTYNIEQYNQYKLLVLLCVTRLAEMGKHNSAIHSILSEIRQLSIGKRDILLPHLPNPCINEINELIVKLDERRHDEDIGKSTQQLLSNYFVSFHDAYELNQGKEFNRKSSERTVTTMLMAPHEKEDDDEGYVVHRLKTEVKENIKLRDSWETEEENNIPEKVQAFAVIKNSPSEPFEQIRREKKSKSVVDRLIMRNQSLSCDYKILTSHEIGKLLTNIFNDLKKNDFNFNYSNTLLLCLLFGRSPADLEEMQAQRKTRFNFDKETQTWKIRIKHKVSTYKQEAAVNHLISRVDEYVDYFLPALTSSLLKNRLTIASTENIQNYLTNFNTKHNTRLSIPRISSYLVDFCKDNNTDPTLIEVITQPSNHQDSSIPYVHIKQPLINETLNLFISHLNKLLPQDHKNLLEPNFNLNVDKGNCVGSPLMLKNDEIIKVNNQHINHINELSSVNSDVVKLHNEFVFYIYRMLTIATGYRPVTGVGGKFCDINFISKEYWISDKENRDRESARIIVAPDTLIQQLNEYKKHLKEIKYLYKFKAIDIATRVDEVLSGVGHFLFFITDDYEIVEITPKTIKPYMDKQFPVQLNWNRHYIRSKLLEINVLPAVIYHFMGHDDIGLEGMGRYSGLSYADFKELAVVIDALLEGLNFKVVKGL